MAESLEMDSVERMFHLKTFPGFDNLGSDELAALVRHAVVDRHGAGEVLFEVSRRVRAFHFVLEGEVMLVENGELIRVFGPRAMLGSFDDPPSSGGRVVAVARGPCLTLRVDRSKMEDLVEEYFELLLAVLRRSSAEIVAARRSLGKSAGFASSERRASPHGVPLGLVQRIDAMLGSEWFRNARIDAMVRLSQEAEELHAPGGALLVSAGRAVERAIVIASGRVRCRASDPIQRFTRGPGDILCLPELFARCAAWYDAVTDGELVGLAIDGERWIDVLEDDAPMAFQTMLNFSNAAQELRERVRQRAPRQPRGSTGDRGPGTD